MNAQALLWAVIVVCVFVSALIGLIYWLCCRSFYSGVDAGLNVGYLRGRRDERAVVRQEGGGL